MARKLEVQLEGKWKKDITFLDEVTKLWNKLFLHLSDPPPPPLGYNSPFPYKMLKNVFCFLSKGQCKIVTIFMCRTASFPLFNPLMYSAFAIELSDLSKPFKFARLKGFERLENCLTKGTFERFWKVKQLSEQTYHSPIFLPFKSFQRVLKGVVAQ